MLELWSAGQVKATLKAVPKDEENKAQRATKPVAATQYLRSSAEPSLTAEECRFSKTGRASTRRNA